MGVVKDEIKGPAPKRKAVQNTNQNLLDEMRSLMDEVSDLIQQKDEDTQKEGPDAAPENIRKAASLRAVHSLLTASKSLLENY